MENNLDSYLAAVEAQLGDLPAARRAEFVDEARAHLHAMVEAKRADGWGEARAVEAALSEFGEASAVGHALREQWASSGQLESEGAPLSWRDVARKFVLPVVAAAAGLLALQWLTPPAMRQGAWNAALYTVTLVILIGIGMGNWRRQGGRWSPANAMIAGVTALILLQTITGLDWGTGRDPLGIARVLQPILVPVVLVECLLWVWLRRRERANRPWQFSARFKTSPVAAEQEYRLAPLIGLAMGTAMGCIGMVSVGLQFFGLPLALLSCAGLIGAAVIFGRWLSK